MKTNTTLHVLDLKENNVGDDGICALATLFRYATRIISLDLEGNVFSCVGELALAKEINSCSCLHLRDLNGVDLTSGECRGILGIDKSHCSSTYEVLDIVRARYIDI
mmetsp:Transcript_20711/g.29760  ORF Transcript_20711/g.29760 Transcript_20711/m.29760 type:complete len:107 (+) Transcript_20711:886-1206(+)